MFCLVFVLARQALYHFRHIFIPFSVYFGDRLLVFCPGWPGPLSSYVRLPATVAGMTDTHRHPSFFSVEMESHKLFGPV
jgi:hypothetical protein